MSQPIAVTILTGFLGAGKTTLLSQILNDDHGLKIAVIENEFGAVPIDNQLLDNRANAIKTLSNGCICCSSANELAEAISDLLDGIDQERIRFEHLIIECTGMADPGPIIQTFFADPKFCARLMLDGVITLVDAVHATEQLKQFAVAQTQIGYADRILLTKTDVQPNYQPLLDRLQQINVRAPIYIVPHGQIELEKLFDIQGFILDENLAIRKPRLHFKPEPHTQVQSIVIELKQPLPFEAISDTMENLLLNYADQLLRYKGILAIKNEPNRLLFQGVQRLYSADWDRPWQANETRQSIMVFIGQNLPKAEIEQAFQAFRD